MSKCVRLRAIAYGYRVALGGRVLGSTMLVCDSNGQGWASTVTIGGYAPLPGQCKTLRQAARQIIKFVKAER